jgi:hypothetical protein
VEDVMEYKLMWKELKYENLKANISNADHDRSKTTGECRIFQLVD